MTLTAAVTIRPLWVPAARWLARILALLAVGMILAFLFGEGVDAARLGPVEWLGMASFAGLCAGLLLGWRREVAGGVLSLAALTVFYAVELAVNGQMLRGWVWPLLGVPAVLYLICAVADRRPSRATAA